VHAAEADAVAAQVGDQGDQVGQGAGEPVEADNDQGADLLARELAVLTGALIHDGVSPESDQSSITRRIPASTLDS
jgi:hypothetical protein